MDRTIRLMRRTLLCAVFVCPLAAVSLPAALISQAVWTLCALLPITPQKALWAKAASGFYVLGGCALFALCLGAALCALSARLVQLVFPPLHAPTLAALRVLAALLSVLTQTALIYRVKQTGRPHYAACLIAVLLTLVCMR